MTTVLEVNELSKNFGNIQALKNVSFTVTQGCVFGILGPNGSGKTTMLGIILDILQPSAGGIQLFGQPANHIVRKKIGTLLETPNFYHYLNAVQNLEIAAGIKGVDNPDIDGVLEKVNLHKRKTSKFQTYSLGMKQRLAIASCLLGDPDVMIFDEPTNGLDPVGIAEIRGLIKTLAKDGKTIIMASHMLDEVEKVCSHVAILKQGVLLATGHVDEILVNDDIVEVKAENMDALQLVLQHAPNHTAIHQGENGTIHALFPSGTANLATLNKYCFDNGISLTHLVQKKKSLESEFIEITNEAEQTA